MSRLSKSLIAVFASIFFVGIASAGLSLVVEYKPYGVPDDKRAVYEEKIAAIEAANLRRKNAENLPNGKAVTRATRFDFGMLDPHTTASHEFPIHNEGDAPLVLEVGETTCKCTVGKVGNRVLNPGQSTTVTLTWNTGYQADRYEQTAFVSTSDPHRPNIELTVEGTVRAKLIAKEFVSVGSANPGESNEGSLLLHSQLWNEFIIEDVSSESKDFTWVAEPVDISTESELADSEANSAWRVHFTCVSSTPGKFEIPVQLTVKSPETGEVVHHDTTLRGRVHQAISFHGSILDSRTGLEMGTMENDRDHEFKLLVRQRTGFDRDLSVLKVFPESLQIELKSVGRRGDHQMIIRVPKGCEPVLFNLDNKQGYVEVGDAETPGLSNWFPIQGAVIEIDR